MNTIYTYRVGEATVITCAWPVTDIEAYDQKEGTIL